MSNLPAPQPGPELDLWSRFTADPRTHAATRASDADRDVAASAIGVAFADGRLDRAEHEERLSAAMSAKTLGDLAPLLADITVTSNRPLGVAMRSPKVRGAALRAWVVSAVFFNIVWLITVLGSGEFSYYWPIWPMLGTAIPLMIGWISGGAGSDSTRSRSRKRRRDEPPAIGR